LEDFVVEDGRHFLERRARDLLAGEIEQHDGCRETRCHRREQGLRGGLAEPILEMPQERLTVNQYALVKRQAQIFCKRALSRSVKA
jgi:hypothetical protein